MSGLHKGAEGSLSRWQETGHIQSGVEQRFVHKQHGYEHVRPAQECRRVFHVDRCTGWMAMYHIPARQMFRAAARQDTKTSRDEYVLAGVRHHHTNAQRFLESEALLETWQAFRVGWEDCAAEAATNIK